ncbi:MAG: sugar ABC transporter permease [Clostridia bacterium]|nr:sugar ABC transporter permease [Clostridia bacterium]
MIIAGREVHIRPEKYYWSDFFLALPAVLLLVLITYYPIAELIRISFTDWRLTMTTAPEYVGWKNWSWLFTAKTSLRYLGNSLKVTLIYTICNIAIDLGIGLILAHLFNRLTKPFALMRALVFMPRYIAMSSCGIIFLWMLNTDYGVINILLEKVGVKNHLNWLGDDNLALVSILLLTGWHGVGYCMMIYLSALLGISRDYYEASSLDGATGLQQFRYITLPLLSPTTLFLFITTFISSMKVYQSVDVMTQGGPRNKTAVMVYYIYDLAFNDNRIDRSAVTALLFFVILLAVTASTLRITNKNVHYEA